MHPGTRIARLIGRRLRKAGWRDVKVEHSPISCSRYVTAWEVDTNRDAAFRISDHYLPSGNDMRYTCIDLEAATGPRPIGELLTEAEALVKDVIEDN